MRNMNILWRRWCNTCGQVYLATALIMLMVYIKDAFIYMSLPDWSLGIQDNRVHLTILWGLSALVALVLHAFKCTSGYYKRDEG